MRSNLVGNIDTPCFHIAISGYNLLAKITADSGNYSWPVYSYFVYSMHKTVHFSGIPLSIWNISGVSFNYDSLITVAYRKKSG